MSTDDRAAGRKIAAEVAPLLGEGWTFDEKNDGYGGKVTGPDGAGLWFHIESGRATITGLYPRRGDGVPYGTQYHSITVSINRPTARIASEITRRLLTRYLPDLETVNRAADRDEHAEEARQELHRELAKLPGVEFWRTRGGTMDDLSLKYGEAYGHVRVSYGGQHASVELNYLTPDQARAVLNALA